MSPPDIGSLLQVSVGFNFAYAFIRALPTYEIRMRERRADRDEARARKRLAGDQAALSALRTTRLAFDHGVDTVRDHVETASHIAITWCVIMGLAAVSALFAHSFGLLTPDYWVRFWLCLALTVSPFAAALALGGLSTWLLRDADRHLRALRNHDSAVSRGSRVTPRG